MRFQIRATDIGGYEVVDLKTGQVRYSGEFTGARAASVKLNLEDMRKS